MNRLAYDSSRGPAQRTGVDRHGRPVYRPWRGATGGAWKRSGRKHKPDTKLDKAPTSTGRIPWRRFSKTVKPLNEQVPIRSVRDPRYVGQ